MIKRYDMTEHCGQHMCDCGIVETTLAVKNDVAY
ncbi:Uncharacterised protein [Serratia quinivorans]|nr:Uncharacterised protein [Serratia quinivorans]